MIVISIYIIPVTALVDLLLASGMSTLDVRLDTS
jgi:hypothetical protein